MYQVIHVFIHAKGHHGGCGCSTQCWTVGSLLEVKVHDSATIFDAPSTGKPRERRPFETGAQAIVPAWTFGKAWALRNFGTRWNTAVVHGFYVGKGGAEPLKGKPTAFFVWETPDESADERQAVLTVLQNVKWQNTALPINTRVINARQGVFAMLVNIEQHLKRGNLAGSSSLIREVELAIADFEEFKIMFSARGAPTQHTGARETIATYEGNVWARKSTFVHFFDTLRRWANFVGKPECFAANHKTNTALFVLAIPAALVARGRSFGPSDAAWRALEGIGLPPLQLSREVPLVPGAVELKSDVGRAAVADARDVVVYLLDEIQLVGYGRFFYAFVPSGYDTGASATKYALMEDKHLFGHVGYVPESVLTWTGPGHRTICATYSEYRRERDGVPLRGVSGVGKPRLHFRPTSFVKESGAISL